MTYGITGNTTKDRLWQPVADLVRWLQSQDHAFLLHEAVAAGLAERGLLADPDVCATDDPSEKADVLLSFGGDGTLLNSAHEAGPHGPPILGVNIGRLGFLAQVEVGDVQAAIAQLEAGRYEIEQRMVLEVTTNDGAMPEPHWALNEFVLERSGMTGLLALEVHVDGTPLNTYWADGLLISTPTGSTAYALAVGGPIVVPGSDVIILTPIAPHSLTVRPIILPATAEIQARIVERPQAYVCAADGRGTLFETSGTVFTFRRAAHTVNLVHLPGQHYFQTLRQKLMWGARKVG